MVTAVSALRRNRDVSRQNSSSHNDDRHQPAADRNSHQSTVDAHTPNTTTTSERPAQRATYTPVSYTPARNLNVSQPLFTNHEMQVVGALPARSRSMTRLNADDGNMQHVSVNPAYNNKTGSHLRLERTGVEGPRVAAGNDVTESVTAAPAIDTRGQAPQYDGSVASAPARKRRSSKRKKKSVRSVAGAAGSDVTKQDSAQPLSSTAGGVDESTPIRRSKRKKRQSDQVPRHPKRKSRAAAGSTPTDDVAHQYTNSSYQRARWMHTRQKRRPRQSGPRSERLTRQCRTHQHAT